MPVSVSCGVCHREAVTHQSPGSRSAPWVSVPPPTFKPRRGFTNGRLVPVPRGSCETPSGFARSVRSGTQSARRDSGLCCLTPSAYMSCMTSANQPSLAPMVNKNRIKPLGLDTFKLNTPGQEQKLTEIAKGGCCQWSGLVFGRPRGNRRFGGMVEERIRVSRYELSTLAHANPLWPRRDCRAFQEALLPGRDWVPRRRFVAQRAIAFRILAARSRVTPWYSFRSSRQTTEGSTPRRSASSAWVRPR